MMTSILNGSTIDVTSTLKCMEIDGSPLSIDQLNEAINGFGNIQYLLSSSLKAKLQRSVDLVDQAVVVGRTIYGVTTGFGGMAGVPINKEQAAASQSNLLSFLATGAGDRIDGRHVRGAMLLRANVLAQGCSGVRYEIIERLLKFLEAGATPNVHELGSIGASGDLVPLSTIARAITGHRGNVSVQLQDRSLSGSNALKELNLEPIQLLPKEGLALINGTSFSAAIAANCVHESTKLMSLTFGIQGMMLQALQVQEEPFEDFVHQKKAHPGQVWSAKMISRLLKEGRSHGNGESVHVQDRYSLRCFPQYMGAIVEGMARITDVVETEMNSVSDNPLIDIETGQFHQSGNFLGQYVGLAMDDLRKFLGLMAKHLDVQIATLVAPEFNSGLPASLQGNASLPYNMGLKGLQITGNSIMPMLTWYGNPIVDHFPTHAEQFNQNVNGLSWGSANLAWKSVELYQHYLSVALIFSIQALDLRAKLQHGHYDGRSLLGSHLVPLYEAACDTMNSAAGPEMPFLFNDCDQSLEKQLLNIKTDLCRSNSCIFEAMRPTTHSFHKSFFNS